MNNRRESREIVFALLFEWSFKEDRPIRELLTTAEEARDIVLDEFAQQLLDTTAEHVVEIDHMIDTYSQKWKVGRISKVTLANLRMSFCELCYFSDIPEGATINEAVELVKKYGSTEEAAYINGILGGYTRRDTAEE